MSDMNRFVSAYTAIVENATGTIGCPVPPMATDTTPPTRSKNRMLPPALSLASLSATMPMPRSGSRHMLAV